MSSRLDHFLFSLDWLEHDTLLRLEVLPNAGSDHILILLRPSTPLCGPCPFKFELMWLKIPGFLDKLKLWWTRFRVDGTTSYMFAQKLKMLKERIMTWKREEFVRVESRKVKCLKRLNELSLKGMVGSLDVEEAGARRESKQEYKRLLRMKKISWRQKSKVM